MIQHRRLEHQFVEDIPEALEPGFLYVSIRYATAMHLCCCGCGREVVTPFSPAQWHMTYDGESVSLHPSIGNWNIACRSHYIIQNGRVIEAPVWSDDEAAYGEDRDKRSRTIYYAAQAATKDNLMATGMTNALPSWMRRIRDFLSGHNLR